MSRSVFPSLIGNDHLKHILGSDLIAARLGHAYILEGPRGSGRHMAALAAAASLSCENRLSEAHSLPCGTCLSCRKITRGVSPDVITIRRPEGKATIGVDTIRLLREDLYIIPSESEYKVYILEEAELMTTQAQNALLLSLEEPPRYAVFFLLTENADALLETIRSRAPVLRMQLFDAEQTAAFLEKESRYAAIKRSDPAFFAESVTASAGALGQAQTLLDRTVPDGAEYRAMRADALRFLSLLFTHDPIGASAMLEALPKSREDVLALLRLVMLALRDLIAVRKNASVPLMLYLSREECRQILEKTGIRRITAAYDEVIRVYGELQGNASVQTACTSLLFGKY